MRKEDVYLDYQAVREFLQSMEVSDLIMSKGVEIGGRIGVKPMLYIRPTRAVCVIKANRKFQDNELLKAMR